jgi:hypothetical protein
MYYFSRVPYGTNVKPIVNYSAKDDEEQRLYSTTDSNCRRSNRDYKNDVNLGLENRNSEDNNMLAMCIGIFICIFFLLLLAFPVGYYYNYGYSDSYYHHDHNEMNRASPRGWL